MSDSDILVHEFDTTQGHYQVVDMLYDGRPARVLFSGNRQAAQSGLATDGQSDLLFDYNQRLFELVTAHRPLRLLVIGGGMYTLPSALLRTDDRITIDVVELDEGLDDIAAQYFGLVPDPRLRIIHTDGLKYLSTASAQYDMIILDAYSHSLAEPSLTSPEALTMLKQHLQSDGIIAANTIAAYFGRRAQSLHQLAEAYQHQFGDVALFPASQSLSLWLPQNLILVAAQHNNQIADVHLRYRRLQSIAQPFDLGRDLRA